MPNTEQDSTQSIDKSQSIRHKLYAEETSNWKRYAILVTGDTSVWKLFKYEIIVLLFGSLPGALGLALRQKFYPKLFKQVGRGAVFGRNLVIRNAENITLGNGVVIDDQTLIDARGAGDDGIVIGDESVLNRDVMVIAKVGGIHIGANTDIGSRTMVISTGGIRIGDKVAIAGDCKIGGSTFSFETGDDGKRTVNKFSKGLVQIDDQCTIFMSATILDGVHIKQGSVVGPSIVLRDNVEADTVVAAHQKLVHLPINATQTNDAQNKKPVAAAAQPPVATGSQNKIIAAVYAAVDELNLLRPPEKQLSKQHDASLAELDSLDLVNLIVETEFQIEELLGIAVSLSGETSTVGRDALENLGAFINEAQVILQGKTE